MKLSKFILGYFLLFYLYSFSQIPPYYNGLDFNLNGQLLESDLSVLITTTHANLLPYTSSSADTWDAVKQSDLDPDNSENVLLFYGFDDTDGISRTDYTRDKDLSCHSSSCQGLFNREHVYAKSMATPSLDTDYPGSGTDAHNLRACDSQMNSSRSNRLFQDDSGDSHITSSGEWYPGDEWKGDVARIIMYMHIRYPSQCPANDIATGANTIDTDMPDVFLQWNIDDPVSEYELQRNTILESMQGNRNPFIDNPYLATKIWGGEDAEDTWGLLSTNDFNFTNVKIYPMPVNDRLYLTNIALEDIDVMVYNVNGQEIYLPITSNYLDVEELSNGMYFLRIVSNESLLSYKFIKN
jgi:endonuclease I